MFAALLAGCKKETTVETTTPVAPEATSVADNADAPVAFADGKYTDIIKKAMGDMASGNMDSWSAAYADNAKYIWNNGDSLVGKPAIEKFWRDRRANTLESLQFSEQIYLPVDVRKPQAKERAGIWLLTWYKVDATYKGGKKMTQWMNMCYHFDANDKIDYAVHYRDSGPIAAAQPKK